MTGTRHGVGSRRTLRSTYGSVESGGGCRREVDQGCGGVDCGVRAGACDELAVDGDTTERNGPVPLIDDSDVVSAFAMKQSKKEAVSRRKESEYSRYKRKEGERKLDNSQCSGILRRIDASKTQLSSSIVLNVVSKVRSGDSLVGNQILEEGSRMIVGNRNESHS